MLKCYRYLKLNGAKTPTLLSFIQLYLAPNLEALKAIIKEYQRQLGIINQLANSICPDVSFVASKLSKANYRPLAAYLAALKYLIRYIQAISNYRLIFSAPNNSLNSLNPIDLYRASNAAFRDNSICISTKGYIIYVRGSLVIQKLKKQLFIALLTAEVEFINLILAG